MKLYKQWLKKRAVWFGAGMYVQSLGTHMQGYNVKIRKKDLGVILRVGLWTKGKNTERKFFSMNAKILEMSSNWKSAVE